MHFVWVYMGCCEILPMAVLADPRPTQRRATHGRAGQSTSGQPGAGHIRAVQGMRTGSAGPIRARRRTAHKGSKGQRRHKPGSWVGTGQRKAGRAAQDTAAGAGQHVRAQQNKLQAEQAKTGRAN